MKFTIIILILSLFVSCANEPLKPYNLNKTELENAQKTYENSTIQHQKVQSKSIITITKNETKVLAMIEIFQNWELDNWHLDTTTKVFRPVVEEAKAKLTYYNSEYGVQLNINKVEYNENCDCYSRYFNLGVSKTVFFSLPCMHCEIPLNIDFNGIQRNQNYTNHGGSSEGYSFTTYQNKHNITLLKITPKGSMINKIFSREENINLQFNSIIITEDIEFEKL